MDVECDSLLSALVSAGVKLPEGTVPDDHDLAMFATGRVVFTTGRGEAILRDLHTSIEHHVGLVVVLQLQVGVDVILHCVASHYAEVLEMSDPAT